MRSNKWKYWGDKNPLKKDNKIPDSGDNGEENEEPVIEKIVGGAEVNPPRKYKVSCSVSASSLESFSLHIMSLTCISTCSYHLPLPTLQFFASLGGCGGSLVAPNVVLSAAREFYL